MASGLHFIVLLCLTSGLLIGANASSETPSDDCCKICPLGWTQFGQSCYMFHHSEKEWADAERFCTSLGGNLASLHTTDEYEYLRKTLHRVIGSQTETWVGGYDAAKEGVWLWSDGSKFDFKLWAKGEPNNASGKENCMEINYNGKDYVNDTDCDKKRSFFCVKRL